MQAQAISALFLLVLVQGTDPLLSCAHSHPLQSRQGTLGDVTWGRCPAGRCFQVVSSDSVPWCLLARTLISIVESGDSWELDTIPDPSKGYRGLLPGHSDQFMGRHETQVSPIWVKPDIWLSQRRDQFFLPGMNEKTRGNQQPSWNHMGSQTQNKVNIAEGRAKRQK